MRRTLLALTLFLAITPAVRANPITISATNGSNLSATAQFALVGSHLQVTLTNISQADVLAPADVLTALFFDLGAGVTLTPVSAVLATGSRVFFGPDGGGNVGGEWAYLGGLSGAPSGATQGISSAGFGLFGAGNFPGGANLQGPTALGGLNYGLTSVGDNVATGNQPVTGRPNNPVALIQDSIVFTFAYAGPLTLSDISHVSFQYGTGLNEPNIKGTAPNLRVPDGGMTITLLGLALAGLGLVARRKK